MACTVEFRVAQLEERAKQIEPLQIVLSFLDPSKVKPDRVVVLEVPG